MENIYFSLEDAAEAFSIAMPYSVEDCYEALLYSIKRGYIKPAMVRECGYDVWEPIKDPYGNLEGWLHTRCGRGTREASKYCPECGRKMDLPKVKFHKMGKRYD